MKQSILNDCKLVNYKSHRGHDGMEGFNATLVYKGVKLLYLHDDAYGGEVESRLVEHDSDKLKALFWELKDRTRQVPKVKSEYGEHPYRLDSLFFDLVTQTQIKKDEKKGVVVKENIGWSVYGFKTSIPNTIKKWEDGLNAIQKVYDEQIAKGAKVLNIEYLKSVGVKV